MPKLATLLETEGRTVDQGTGAFERLRRRRDRRRRNRRIGSALVAMVVTLATVGYAFVAFHRQSEPQPVSEITVQNVGELGVSWSTHAATGFTPTVIGNELWLIGWNSDTSPSFYDIEALPLGCQLDTGGCQPRVVASLGGDFNRTLLIGDSSVYTGAGQNQAGLIGGGGAGSKLRASITAFPKSCDIGPCAALWKGTIGAAGQRDYLTPVAAIGPMVYAVPSRGGSLFAFATTCDRKPCPPVWRSPALSPPTQGSGSVFVYSKAGIEAFAAGCWNDHGGGCRPVWIGRLDGISAPAHLAAPQVVGDVVLASDAKGISAFPVGCHGSCAPTWTASVPGGPGFPLVVSDGLVIAAASGGPDLYAFPFSCAPGRCKPKWVAHVDGGVGFQPTVVDGDVLVAAVLGDTLSTYPESCSSTCEPDRVIQLPDSIVYPPEVSNDLVYVSGIEGVTVFPDGCADPCAPVFHWKVPTGGPQASPLVVRDRLLLQGDFVLYDLEPGAGAAPPRPAAGSWIWLGPAILTLVIASVIVSAIRRRRMFTL